MTFIVSVFTGLSYLKKWNTEEIEIYLFILQNNRFENPTFSSALEGATSTTRERKIFKKRAGESLAATFVFWTWGYRIRLIASPGFYFSKWVFGRGSIQNIAKKVDFWDKKWGFIQENPQKHDFSHYLGLYSRVGLQSSRYGNTFATVNIKRSGTIFGTMYDKFRCTFSRFFNFPSLPTALKINQKNHLNAVNKFILL